MIIHVYENHILWSQSTYLNRKLWLRSMSVMCISIIHASLVKIWQVIIKKCNQREPVPKILTMHFLWCLTSVEKSQQPRRKTSGIHPLFGVMTCTQTRYVFLKSMTMHALLVNGLWFSRKSKAEKQSQMFPRSRQ